MADGTNLPDEKESGAKLSGPDAGDSRPEHPTLRVLSTIEFALLYFTACVLLVVGALVLAVTVVAAVRSGLALPERLILVVEELLLVLIIVEVFATVLASLRGARFMLEPFLLVGVVAVVRHILSIVIRLAVVESPGEAWIRLVELGMDAFVVLALVGALVLNRWSLRRTVDD